MSRMRTHRSIILVAGAFAFSACASSKGALDDGGKRATAADYAPLEAGASWTYSMAYLGQTGEETITMVGEKDGYWEDDHGGAFRHTHDGLRDKQRYLIRHPLMPGNKWKTIVSASAVEHNEILSVGERCETTAGSFDDCVVVESSIRRDKNMTMFIRWTWAKGIGLVKLETEAEIAGKGRVPQVKQSLVRYTVGKGGSSTVQPPAEQDDGPDNWSR
jgi:hypothetical protein